MGVNEIFPLMKWDRIFDLTEFSLFTPVPSPAAFDEVQEFLAPLQQAFFS
jgi:hypothetical protein